MKSFGTTAYAGVTSDDFGQQQQPIQDPEALFSDLQWFIYRARNTVYFTSYSKKQYDQESLMDMVAKMVALAPQLTYGYKGARPGAPLPQKLLEAVTSVETVDNFDGFPDQWLSASRDLFEEKGVPLFRVKAAVLRNGPDGEGRASVIMVRSAHAMLEGADSALLTRSQKTGFAPGANIADEVPLLRKLATGTLVSLASVLHLITANIIAPKAIDMRFATLTFERAMLKRLADRFGIRQRALVFALVMFALNRGGAGFDRKKIRAAYTGLEDDRTKKGDDYFRVRTIMARFPVVPDFETFALAVDDEIARIESQDSSKAQYAINMIMKSHRFLARYLPIFYTDRFFRYAGRIHLVLTLVPPHRIAGNLTRGMIEPVYCGSYHPAINLCAFVPGRKFVTFNFSMHAKYIDHVADVQALLENLDAT